MKYINCVLNTLLQFCVGFVFINVFFIFSVLKSLSVRFPETPNVDVTIKWRGKE